MALKGSAPCASSTLRKAVVALLLITISPACCFPLAGRELDSAVEGVQKYLESSGFPKMTRGEVMDFLDDFSQNSRVSRSRGHDQMSIAASTSSVVTYGEEESKSTTASRPKIPNGESPLNYGFPMSSKDQSSEEWSTTPMIFVTTPQGGVESASKTPVVGKEDEKTGVRSKISPKKITVPSTDLNAYSKFKKIPEARNLKIDDDMKEFLNTFGLLDGPERVEPKATVGTTVTDSKQLAAVGTTSANSKELQRRNDEEVATVTADSVDRKLLESLLLETSDDRSDTTDRLRPFLEGSQSSGRDHVFNPTDSDVKTVDIDRIAKIVQNIRLLTEDNETVSLPPDAFQKRLENITAAISAIDRQPQPGDEAFDGYDVFFDDSSKEVDADPLPDSPGETSHPLDAALNPPDPLSDGELEQLLEKNKSDVKRQEPDDNGVTSFFTVGTISSSTARVTSSSTTGTTSSSTTGATFSPTVGVTTPSEVTARTTPSSTARASTDSSSEATSVETTSVSGAARGASTAGTEANPSLSQLAESFGGGETASSPPPEVPTDAPLNRPRNGLYFYVDWNSFLTVNQGQKNQVNLRFAPKAGNPAHFLRVNIP